MKRRKHKKMILIGAALSLVIVFAAWVIWANTAPELNYITVKSSDLPAEFSGYRIAHVSDLHNADMAEDLIGLLKEAEPNMIAITGDIVDYYHTDFEIALRFVRQACQIAPCYYVTGNHEARIDGFDTFAQQMAEAGVTVLANEQLYLEQGGERITLIGVEDPSFHLKIEASEYMESILQELKAEKDSFTLLLSHRPELFAKYTESGANLVLSGHAHGGQFRLPFVGGLYAPSQGVFPEYDAGLYQSGNTQMVVSRGIGNSSFPLRFNNRPEIILIELQTE